MKYPRKRHTRRSFVKKIAGTAVATGALPLTGALAGPRRIPQQLKSYAANDQVNIATIGMGIMGYNNTYSTLKVPGVKLVSVCDLYDGHLESAREIFGQDIMTTRNYREVLDREDIDAVIVATPDHWHDHIAIEAMNKGKAVYCEKPMVHKIEEGKAVIAAEQKNKAVFQVGSQGASSIVTRKAAELYKSGAIGQLVMIETYNDRHSAMGAWQYSIPTDASKKTIDWDQFLGDAPKRDFDPVRFFRWRNYRDYGTGVAGDLFVHLFTGMHVILDTYGPERIYASGGLRYWNDGREVPDVMLAVVDYPETGTHPAFNLQIRVNFVAGGGGGSLTRLVGSEGTMDVRWGSISIKKNKMSAAPGYGGWDTYETFSSKQKKEYEKWYAATYPNTGFEMNDPGELTYSAPEGYSADVDHHTVFHNAIRTGSPIVEDASFGLRAAGPSLATNVSYFGNKIVNWDPKGMSLL